MDQSGVLDRVEEHIAKYDTNKDGTFSVAEVKAIVEELEKEEAVPSGCFWSTLAVWCWIV